MLKIIEQLLIQFEDAEIKYCHWKSNMELASACHGEGDLDFLFDRKQGAQVSKILLDHGFKRAESNIDRQYPGLDDYFGYDIESGKLVHLQAHFQLVSGQPITKNYRFSIEQQMLNQLRLHDDTKVPIPVPTLEAAVHIFRTLIKLGWSYSARPTSLQRHLHKASKELEFLLPNGVSDFDDNLFTATFPHIDIKLFVDLIEAMSAQMSLFVWYRYRIRICLLYTSPSPRDATLSRMPSSA